MLTHSRARSRRRARPTRRWWLVLGVLFVAVGLVFAAFLVKDLTSPTPARLTLPRAAGTGGAVVAGPVSGTWSVGKGSEVGYRVHEILFGLSHTAVGRTGEVSGGITMSGTRVVAAAFTVDMASVETDQAGREVMWRNYIMNTGAYPQARFRLTRPIALGSVPTPGKVVTVHASGDLTMRGVTRAIRFRIRGERVSASTIDLDAEIPITFKEWNIPNPSFAVAKVGRTGTLEVLLHLNRAKRG